VAKSRKSAPIQGLIEAPFGEEKLAAALPPGPGAYALLIALARPARLGIATLGKPRLNAGAYIYVGSANGPGGMRARLIRHIGLHVGRKNPATTPHWHVDHLAGRGRIRAVLAVAGGVECALADRVRELKGAGVPVAGFGSSDCRHCPAHLFAVPEDGMVVLAALANKAALNSLSG
jgi:Uri superfamily endonuclease